MCLLDNHIELSSTANTHITYCKGCKTFTLIFKSTCASYTEEEMRSFLRVIENLGTEDFRYPMLGEQRAIVKNPNVWLGFTLTEEDRDELVDAMKQSFTLFDAFGIIYN